jgi:hypothetical protein
MLTHGPVHGGKLSGNKIPGAPDDLRPGAASCPTAVPGAYVTVSDSAAATTRSRRCVSHQIFTASLKIPAARPGTLTTPRVFVARGGEYDSAMSMERPGARLRSSPAVTRAE